MKNRSGFVSNSSSSSFIVATKKGDTPTATISIQLPIDRKISTQKELDRYFVKEYACVDTLQEVLEEEYLKITYDACVAALKKGKVLHFGSVGNDYDDPESIILYDRGVKTYIDNGEVIQD